jgi:hypothetical protein
MISLIFFQQEHVQEVLSKWESIDDEIWAKIIVLVRIKTIVLHYKTREY